MNFGAPRRLELILQVSIIDKLFKFYFEICPQICPRMNRASRILLVSVFARVAFLSTPEIMRDCIRLLCFSPAISSNMRLLLFATLANRMFCPRACALLSHYCLCYAKLHVRGRENCVSVTHLTVVALSSYGCKQPPWLWSLSVI